MLKKNVSRTKRVASCRTSSRVAPGQQRSFAVSHEKKREAISFLLHLSLDEGRNERSQWLNCLSLMNYNPSEQDSLQNTISDHNAFQVQLFLFLINHRRWEPDELLTQKNMRCDGWLIAWKELTFWLWVQCKTFLNIWGMSLYQYIIEDHLWHQSGRSCHHHSQWKIRRFGTCWKPTTVFLTSPKHLHI